MKVPLTVIQIWGAPIALGLISTIGLITALVSNGIGDVMSWIALATPIAVVFWHGAASLRYNC